MTLCYDIDALEIINKSPLASVPEVKEKSFFLFLRSCPRSLTNMYVYVFTMILEYKY